MANEDSPSFNLGISQIEIQKVIYDGNQIVDFTPGKFDYTKLGYSENRSKQRNDPEKLKNLRKVFAEKNKVLHMQMEDLDEIEQIRKFSSKQNVSLLVKKRLSHNVRIGNAHNINVVDKLNEVLDDEGIRMFRSTCFGSFLDLPNCNFQDKTNIPARDFHMMDDRSYHRFPWRKVAFEKLMASISRSMNDVQKFYRLSGLPYALQIWWYECCAKVDESLAVRVDNLIPRMVNWKVVKPKPRYEDLMDDMFSKLVYRNITPSPQELNHVDLPNPLMFGSTDDDANIAQAVDEFDDFSTPPSADLLKKMKLNAGPSIDRVSLDKNKDMPNVKMRDADKASAASEEKISLSKSDLDEIKSYVSTYIYRRNIDKIMGEAENEDADGEL
ncbi:hypothetical protein FXO38_08198 [Capsicum annuum]|nr:hypothetical protein FXO38_08198 [Capsicum annuum]